MGAETRVKVKQIPDWATLRDRLTTAGHPPILRMIDGLPAFPDEQPEATWAELRLAFPEGMVTLRRTGDDIACIVWGTDDAALLRVRDLCASTLSSLNET